MNTEDPQGAQTPEGEPTPHPYSPSPAVAGGSADAYISHEQQNDRSWYHDESYTYDSPASSPAQTNQPGAPSQSLVTTPVIAGGSKKSPPPPPPPPPDEPDDPEEEGMVRMSFLGHLEELRRRIFYILAGFIIAFLGCMLYCKRLWLIISEPAVSALMELGVKPPTLSQLTPMEGFNVIWIKVPVLCSIFVSSPWIIYQVWAFISPGLYKRERRWAIPFVLCTAGLFITGGLFAFFVAFRFGLVFLLGVGRDVNVTPLVSIDEYFDLFVNVTLGIGLVFELPVLIFFLALLRLVTASFLIRHSRYAILGIFIVAAIVTPTPDIFNLMLFATPMCVLFFVGVFAAYLLQLSREGKQLPWRNIALVVLCLIALVGIGAYIAVLKFGFRFTGNWPFLAR